MQTRRCGSLRGVNVLGRIALIAGEGMLPVSIAKQLSEQGDAPVLYNLRHDFEELRAFVCEVVDIQKPNLGAAIKSMKKLGVDRIIMAGRVPKSLMFKPALLDFTSQKFLAGLLFRDDHSLLGAIVDFFEKQGFKVINYKDIVPQLVAHEGFIAGREPSESELEDVKYGVEICSRLVPLSFGQSVVVNKGAVIAVEAIEGTDKMILRAGELTKGGVVAKLMRLDQDERYDIPTVGPQTLENMAGAGLTCLAVHAGHTMIMDFDKFEEIAKREKISVIGVVG